MKSIYLLLFYFTFFSTNISLALTEWEEFAFDSVKSGDRFQLENCLDNQVSLDVTSGPLKKGLLHVAVNSKQKGILEFLLKRKLDPNQKNIVEDTPLLLASKLYDIQLAELLLQYKADPNITNFYGESPLMAAIEGKKSKLALLLLKYNANPNFIDKKSGKTPLERAYKLGLVKVVKKLLPKTVIVEDSRKMVISKKIEKVKKRSFLQKIFGK